jgi:hypothetical protein
VSIENTRRRVPTHANPSAAVDFPLKHPISTITASSGSVRTFSKRYCG